MLVRCHSEYMCNYKHGGKVAFLTFTYSDEYVPAYGYTLNKESNRIDFERVNPLTTNKPFIYAFEKKRIQRFFNSYRKKLEKIGLKHNFRYFAVPEYGTNTRFTQRPHFHVLLYLSNDMVEYYGRSDIRFLQDVRHYWKYGMIDVSDAGTFVNSDAAIKYTSKYVSKSSVIDGLLRFKEFRKFIDDNLQYISIPDNKVNTIVDVDDNGIVLDVKYQSAHNAKNIFKYYVKQVGSNLFTLKSKNFGLYAIKEILPHLRYNRIYEHDLTDDIINKVADFYYRGYKIQFNGETKYIPFSNYYRRKILYTTRADGSFALSRIGYYVNNIIGVYKVRDYIDKVIHLDSSNIVNISGISKMYNVSNLINEFDEFRSDYDNLKSLALYIKYVRGRSIPFGKMSDVKYYLFGDGVSVKQSVRYFMSQYYRLINNIYYYEAKEIDVSLDNFYLYKRINQKKYYEPFHNNCLDTMAYIVEQLLRIDSIAKHTAYKEKATHAKYLRDLNNLTKYKN